MIGTSTAFPRSARPSRAIPTALVAWVVVAAPPEETSTPEEAAAVEPIPGSAKKLKNPVKPTAESIENGKLLFSSQCAMCHGAAGDGSGDLAARLDFDMPDFTNPEEASMRTDGEWFHVITNGKGAMKGYGSFTTVDERWEIVHYLRALQQSQNASDEELDAAMKYQETKKKAEPGHEEARDH